MPADFDPAELNRVFVALAEVHDCRDSVIERVAIEAASEGRAAYACTASYHHQVAGLFAYDANVDGLDAALSRWADENRRHCRAADLRGRLVPLNTRASVALAEFDASRRTVRAA